jgi:hypothetical protein
MEYVRTLWDMLVPYGVPSEVPDVDPYGATYGAPCEAYYGALCRALNRALLRAIKTNLRGLCNILISSGLSS